VTAPSIAMPPALVVRPPTSALEFRSACTMANERYRAAGYVRAGAALSDARGLLVAARGASLLGSAGIQSGDAGVLPTERAFGFRGDDVFGIPRALIFELTRFAIVRGADVITVKALMAGALLYAGRRHDYRIWVFSLRPPQQELMRRRCHLRATPLPHGIVDASLRTDYPGYWGADPAPHAAWVDRAAGDAALAQLLPEVEPHVRFDLDRFDHRRDPSGAYRPSP
jgi:hypothetical protein